MSKQILEDKDARKDLNQAQYNANEELNEAKVQVYTGAVCVKPNDC